MQKNILSYVSDIVYATSMEGITDIMIVLLWVAATVVSIVTFPDSAIRTILGMSMVIFIPGYVSVRALFVRDDELKMVGTIAMSIGLSLVVVVLLGLLLNFTFGLGSVAVTSVLIVYVAIMSFVAIYRQRKLGALYEGRVYYESLDVILKNIRNIGTMPTKSVVFAGIIILLSMLTIYVAYLAVMTPKVGEKFTEFYVLDSSGNTDYPTELRLDYPVTFSIGVINHEYSVADYTLQVTLDGEILNSEELVLGHNDVLERNVMFVPDRKGNDMKLEFLLFKDNDFSIPYRRLYLWVDVT